MDDGFRSIYNRQLQELLLPTPTAWLGNQAQRVRALSAIRAALTNSPRLLRPDAELFLLLNLDDMVIRPVASSDSPVSAPDLDAKLAMDTTTILVAANEVAPADRNELAASHILRGTANVLDDLNLKSFRLWEKD